MKILLPALLLCTLTGFCQDSLKIKEIDSLVKVINQSDLKVQYDTILQDYSSIGLVMRTYLTMALDKNELKKYASKVNTMRTENDKTRQIITSTTFFYDQNKLIKVEDFEMENAKEVHADWYYSDDKSLYYTLQSERSADRADLLLTIAKKMLIQIQQKR